jgi:hypothetical protein
MVYDWQTGDVWFDEPDKVMNHASRYVLSSEEFDWRGSVDGYVYKGNSGSTDDGEDVDWDIQMAPNDLGYPGREKQITNVITIYERQTGSQTVNHVVVINQGNAPSRSGSLTLGSTLTYNASPAKTYDSGIAYGSEQTSEELFFVNRVCRTIAPRWHGSAAFELAGYRVDFNLLE